MSDEELNIIISASDKASKVMGEVAGEIDEIEGSTKKADGKLANLTDTLKNIATGAVIGGVVAVATAVGAIGFASLDVAGQFNQAQREMQGELGVTEQEAENLANVAFDVFGNNFGGSVIEAKDAVVVLQQQIEGFSDLGQDLMGKVTEEVFMLKDAFGVEVPKTVNATKALMENFGISATEATSLIADGFQNGLNSSDDFLESITEYSTQFGEGGASVDEFFNVMSSGLGTGMLGTDKAADLFKEFVVRIQDGSKLTAESLEMIGIDSDDMLAKLADGTIEPIDAFKEVQKALKGVDDEAVLMQSGVGLLGTQFEDLGASAVMEIDTMGEAFDKSGEAFEDISKRYDNFQDLAQGAWRQILIAFKPFADQLLEFANDMLPYVIEGVEWLTDTLTDLGENPAFVNFVDEVWQNLVNGFIFFQGEVLPLLVQAFQDFMVFFQEEMLPVIQEVWAVISQEILPQIIPIIREIIIIFQALWPVISWVLMQFWNLVKIVIQTVIGIFSGLVTYIKGFYEIISGILTGDMEKVGEGFKHVIEGMGKIVESVFNGIIDSVKNGVNGAVDTINGLIDKIPDQAGFFKPPKLPRFAKGGSFITNGAMPIIVGDNPGGKERVDITPVSSPNIDGPKGGSGGGINININLPSGSPIFMNAKSIRDFIREAKPILRQELAK